MALTNKVSAKKRKEMDALVMAMGYKPQLLKDDSIQGEMQMVKQAGQMEEEIVFDRQQRPSDENPTVLKDGEAHPEYGMANLTDYGFTCPREHFIEDPKMPTVSIIAGIWGLSENRVKVWAEKGQWERRRAEYWAEVKKEEWEYAPAAVARQRQIMTQEHLRDFRHARKGLTNAARKQTKTIVNPSTGELEKVEWDMNDWAKYSKALLDLTNGERLASGMDTKVDNGDEFAKEPTIAVKFEFFGDQSMLTQPGQDSMIDVQARPPAALPEVQEAEVVEGEVQ